MGLAACGRDDVGKANTPEIEHSLVNGSVVVKLPKNWISEQNEFSVNRFEVISDTKLREEQDPSDGAMGSFTVEIVDGDSSPAELLAAKLDDAGGAPDGNEIETLEIGTRPAAHMVAMDEMFGQKYLWHTTLIKFDDGVIVYADFMGLGKYELKYVG